LYRIISRKCEEELPAEIIRGQFLFSFTPGTSGRITLLAHLLDVVPAIAPIDPQVVAIRMKVTNVLSDLSLFALFLVQAELSPVDNQSSAIGSDISRVFSQVTAVRSFTCVAPA